MPPAGGMTALPLASDAVLQLRGVGVRRGQSMLLSDVSWTVFDDQSWVIVGPNGAGKTTLLQIAAGLLAPTEGYAEVLGEHISSDGVLAETGDSDLTGPSDLAELRSRVGIASAAVAEEVPRGEKVIDLVMTAGYGILGRGAEDYDSSDVTRAVELLDAVGCAHLIRRKFGTLSEGERKRVQIARSLMADPELLLLDEPAAGLDLGGREDLLSMLAGLVRDPRSPVLVLVTHHVEEVPEGFSHAMLMRRGMVLAAGPVAEVFTERNLSRCFGVPLIVERLATRWMARAAPPR
jgi:iron complex transport system ATP-binding protein